MTSLADTCSQSTRGNMGTHPLPSAPLLTGRHMDQDEGYKRGVLFPMKNIRKTRVEIQTSPWRFYKVLHYFHHSSSLSIKWRETSILHLWKKKMRNNFERKNYLKLIPLIFLDKQRMEVCLSFVDRLQNGGGNKGGPCRISKAP